MADVGAGNGLQEPNENAGGDREGAPRRNGPILNLGTSVKRLFSKCNHVSDWLPQLNARYFYLEQKRLQEMAAVVEQRREAKRQRVEKEKEVENRMYPSQHFIECAGKSDGSANIRGAVLLPDSSTPVPVLGHVLHVESSGQDALVVLCPVSEWEDQYMAALCPTKYIPKPVIAPLQKIATKVSARKEWKRVEFDTYQVARGTQLLHFITDGPLSNRTCDDAMAESLRRGFVLAVRGGDKKSKLRYGVSPLPFANGEELESSKVFTVSLESNKMNLNYPSRASRDLPARVLRYAREARNRLIVESSPNSTLTGALDLMQEYASNQNKSQTTDVDRSLNVALGGSSVFGQYGRIVPCAVLSQRDGGSYSSRPCSCDIEIGADCPKKVKESVRRMKPSDGNRKGHNYVGRRT